MSHSPRQNRTPLRLGRFRTALTCGGLALSALLPTSATAQTVELMRPLPLPAMGRSLVGNGDSTALVQNPANLAFLPGYELRWTGAFLNEDAEASSQGHAVAAAFPLWKGAATGFRFDMINPTNRASDLLLGESFNYQWFTWGLGMGSETASLGITYQHSYSDAPAVHDFSSWTAGINLRPSDYLGLGGVIRNFNNAESDAGLTLGRSYDLGASIRPMGTDDLEIALENSYVDEQGGYWVPRAVLDVAVPTLGRIRGDFAWIDPIEDLGESSWVASTSLVITANTRKGSGEFSMGTRYGNALSANQPHHNVHGEVAFRGFRENSAADNLPYALRVRIEQTPGARGHVKLLRSLWKMADEEPHLGAVLLELRAAPAGSLAHVQELQDAIYHLQSRGKKVLCHLESATGSALYLCSAADSLLINPAGGIRYSGLSSSTFYLKGLLDKLGMKADFVRIGKHKSAPEGLSRTEGSATALSDRANLLQQIEMEISSTISRGRKLELSALRSSVDEGPFTASEAKEAGLVDGYAFDDMLEEKTSEVAGETLLFEKGRRAPTRDPHFGPKKRLAIVYVDGDMVDGRSESFPFVGVHTAGSYTIAESLKKVREDATIGAVVLRVETGGGSAMAADVIWREIQLTQEKKPVVVSMGAAAASGGYYVSAPAGFIYANPLTITGSIGVFYGKLDVAGLLSKIGVNVETLTTAKHADAQSVFRPYTDEEREVLKRKVESFYSLFLSRVAEGREMSTKEVDRVARGRVWTGREAKKHNLVDGLGGLRQALAKARVLAELRDDSPILELPVQKTSLLGRVLGVQGLKAELESTSAPLPKELMDMARAVAPYALFPADQPLTRVEHLPLLLK